MEIRKGDNVIVLTGKDKGKKADVIKAYPAKGKVVLEGVNMVKKAVKPRNTNERGGIVSQPAAIDVSNVMLVCPSCGQPTRVSHDKKDGKNVRVCKKCGAVIDVKTAKKAAKKATAKKKTAPKAEVPGETETEVK